MLDGAWRSVVLGIVWVGAAVGIALKFLWVDGSQVAFRGDRDRHSAGSRSSCFPRSSIGVGIAGSVLVLAGGIAYTAGALVYALRRPDPVPAVFGYHEVFHALVIVAVACQYSTIAFYVLPDTRS